MNEKTKTIITNLPDDEEFHPSGPPIPLEKPKTPREETNEVLITIDRIYEKKKAGDK
jgi:hypothetical protein